MNVRFINIQAFEWYVTHSHRLKEHENMSTWSLHNQEILQIIVPKSENPTLEVIQKVGEYVQFEEEWNLLAENTTDKLKSEARISASSEPPKKKRWTEKANVISM